MGVIGILIVDDEKLYWEYDGKELFALNDSYEIEILIEGKYVPITYQKAITTFCEDGWSVYGGMTSRIRRKAV